MQLPLLPLSSFFNFFWCTFETLDQESEFCLHSSSSRVLKSQIDSQQNASFSFFVIPGNGKFMSLQSLSLSLTLTFRTLEFLCFDNTSCQNLKEEEEEKENFGIKLFLVILLPV